MAEPSNGGHPDAAELQSHADGEGMDERVLAHVASCASCREEVAAIRRLTAALALGSRRPDSLCEKIRARRAESMRDAQVVPLRAPRRRRTFLLPAGLAAAAALALFVPRAWREDTPDVTPPASGAKGSASPRMTMREMIVTEAGAASIDSISWDVASLGITAEVSYTTELAESPRAARLANQVVERLVEGGLARPAITVLPVPLREQREPLPPGSVRVRLRAAL
jgi:hypothetical protein